MPTIMAQEHAIRCCTNVGLSGFNTVADFWKAIEEYGTISHFG